MGDRRVFVVGSLNADHRVRVARIPAAGETVMGSDVVVAAGGKGANQAVAAARAGAAVRIIGAVGDDSDGALVRRALADQDVDTRHVHVVDAAATGRALVTVDDRGENTIVVSPGANAELSADDVSRGMHDIDGGDFLLLQLETPVPLVLHAARTARDAGATVVVNAAPVPREVRDLLDATDLLVVNEHELVGAANILRGNETADRDADMALLAQASGGDVVCTAGSRGAFVTVGDRIEHVEALPVTATDTTAAGDTFIGYLAAGLTAGDDLIGAIEYAVRAAGIAVTRSGAIDSIPHSSEIDTAPTAQRTAYEDRTG